MNFGRKKRRKKLKKCKIKSWTGWVDDTKIYSNFDTEYVARGVVIYKKKRFDTPHKVKLTLEEK